MTWENKTPYSQPADLVRRATAIIEMPDGVLVTANKGGRFYLPGGRAIRGELRSQALIREVREHTGLRINSMLYLFDHLTHYNAHKVYVCIAQGQVRMQGETERVSVVSSPDAEVELLNESRTILRRYARLRAEDSAKGEALRALLGLARYIAKI